MWAFVDVQETPDAVACAVEIILSITPECFARKNVECLLQTKARRKRLGDFVERPELRRGTLNFACRLEITATFSIAT